MKLISLNTWGGRAGKEKLLGFFEQHKDVDIFCLQEIWNGGHDQVSKWGDTIPSLFTDIGEVLDGHAAFFRPHFHDWYGLAMFVKKSIVVKEEGEKFVYKDRGYISEEAGNHARNLQYATIETSKGPRMVINLHGLWNGGDKGDSDDRLLQSDNIIQFLKNTSNPHILCGDFNLSPDTKSLKKLEDSGLRNLIKEFGVASTRSSFYAKPQRFADYALVSTGIKVNDFKVLPDEISDHLAMYLDFE